MSLIVEIEGTRNLFCQDMYNRNRFEKRREKTSESNPLQRAHCKT